MKVRMTIAAALALVAVAVPAAGAAPAAQAARASHAMIPWEPRVTHEDPLYRCVVQRGRHVASASHATCGRQGMPMQR